MRDAKGTELRRGDRVIDPQGSAFTVMRISPGAAHLMNMKNGLRYVTTTPLLRVPAKDTRKLADASPLERRNYYRQRINRQRGLKSGR